MKALIFSLTLITLLFFSGMALSQDQNKNAEKENQVTAMMQDSVMVNMMMDKMMNTSYKQCQEMMSMHTMMMNKSGMHGNMGTMMNQSSMHVNMRTMMDQKTQSKDEKTPKRPRNSKTLH